ncbi:MAG: hypothetical protein HY399_07200 [Elusimicrobia bacterium]|nr:hypothetical protein [Elusimicrobiota bacterium]
MKRLPWILITLLVCAPASTIYTQEISSSTSSFENPPTPHQPLLLWERPNPDALFEVEASTREETHDFYEFLNQLPPFEVNEDLWNKAREAVETGKIPGDELPTATSVAVSSGGPSLPPPEVELPSYGTSLSVTGRKVIGFTFSSKKFLNDQTNIARPRSINFFDIQQQLQIRMQGKVGPKISVNVDYDDTKPDKQDISVVYQGDPQDVVQSASFGDIDLSLPSTEFVSYNKQLFGIRVDLKYRGAKLTFVGSRTKGITKTKQFFGNTQLQTKDILDTRYLRRQYYDLTFDNTARLPIKQGSEKVYLSQNSTPINTPNVTNLTVDDLAVQSSSFTDNFILLAPGQDYTIDYIRGILTLRIPPRPQHVLAIDFINNNGTQLSLNSSTSTLDTAGTGRVKLFKTPGSDGGDLPLSSTAEAGYQRELKTFYSVERTQIVRDDGRGNFILRVLDQNQTEVGPSLNPIQKYPDTIDVDFENGFFRLHKPFPEPDIYAPTPFSKRVFRVEFRSRIRTFFLEPNLVLQSETVLVDNIKFQRNVDYFIDYDSGFITFYNEERIRSDSKIDVTYEVAPFGTLGTSSLLGSRLSYDFGKHWAVGSTLLYEAGTKPPTTPTVRDLSKSILVYEADSQLKNVRLLPFLNSNFAAEVAQSKLNPNLSKFALLENMEGIKQQDSTAVDKNFWQIASNPTAPPADPLAVSIDNENVKVLDINPNAQANANDTQQVLKLNYDFTVNSSTEVSIVYPFSTFGLDFSRKSFLEVVVFGQGFNGSTNQGPQINFHLGSINEDADGTGGINLTCSNGTTLLNVPKTEDINCDGQLSPSEDVGWVYSPAGKNSANIGGNNGRIDGGDLNRNNRLDSQDFSGGSFGYVANSLLFDVTDASSKTVVDFNGWHTFQIPLNIVSTDTIRWGAVRQVRISLKQAPSNPATQGTLKFARIAVVGNSWQNAITQGTGTVQINAVNSVDNPAYRPIFTAGGEAQAVFTDLYGSISEQKQQANAKNISEQSLAISYTNLSPGATVQTKETFSRALDISQHQEFRFLLFGNAESTRPVHSAADQVFFFLQVGNDQNYQEVEIPLTFQGWRLYTLALADLNRDQVPDIWENASNYPLTITSTGVPSFQQVSQIVSGIRNKGPSTVSQTVWLNEIHLAKPVTRTGTARKLEANFDVPGWMSFGGKHRYVDRNFQTPVSVVANQDNRQDSAYLNFSRISFFPMNFTLARNITDTPNTLLTGNNNLINLLQQGRVTHWAGVANGNFTLGVFPRLFLAHSRNRTEYDLLTRLDDKKTYSGNLSYTTPWRSRLLPKTIDLNYANTRYLVSFTRDDVLKIPGNFNTDELTNDYGAKLSFIPWEGSNFTPNYTLKDVREKRIDFTGPLPLQSSYPKSLSQTAAMSSSWRILPWFVPSVNYSVTTIENNVLNVTTVTLGNQTQIFDVGNIKTINRTASGGVNVTLNASDFLRNSRPFRSLVINSGYQLQDGDTWQNVEKELSSKSSLWVRTPLKPTNPFSQRSNLTLRDTYNSSQRWAPLEAYNLQGRWGPLKTFSISNNYTESIQRSDVTGTVSKNISRTLPDLVTTLSQVEMLMGTERWMKNAQVNMKFSRRTNETVSISLTDETNIGNDLRFLFRDRLDTSTSFNVRNSKNTDLRTNQISQSTHHRDISVQTTFDIRQFRFTPKMDYFFDQTTLGTSVISAEVTQITPSLLVRADISLPRGLSIPFTGKTLIFSNRIIWTTTASLARRRSPISVADNSDLFSLNTSSDYEIAKNLRMTLNGSFQRLSNKFLKQEDYISYQLGTTLTFQF